MFETDKARTGFQKGTCVKAPLYHVACPVYQSKFKSGASNVSYSKPSLKKKKKKGVKHLRIPLPARSQSMKESRTANRATAAEVPSVGAIRHRSMEKNQAQSYEQTGDYAHLEILLPMVQTCCCTNTFRGWRSPTSAKESFLTCALKWLNSIN